eukprot:COSAG01_NODE_2_length_63927_cov_1357.611941_44_plen_560_part_00
MLSTLYAATTTHEKWDQIDKIIITGNYTVQTEQIKTQLLIKEKDLMNPYKLSRSIKNLRAMGMFKNINHSFTKEKNKNTLIITMQENPIVTALLFEGNQTYTDQKLTKLSPIKINKNKNLKTIRKTIQKIENLYKDNGYIQAKIYKIETPISQAGPAIFYISEGRINSIRVSGNNKTRDYVILREIDIKPGDAIQTSTLRKSLNQIYNLGYFEEVLPELKQGKNQNDYDILIRLKEKESQGSISAGAGYGGESGFSLFSDLFWNNIYGTGQQIMLKGTLAFGKSDSKGYNSFQFKYHNPWAWDKRKSFTFRTWLTRGDVSLGPFNSNNNISFRNEVRAGYDMTIGWPHKYDFYANHKIKFESIDVTQIKTKYELLSYTYILNLDRRDIHSNPTKGFFHTVSIEKTIKLNPSMVNFIKTDAIFRNFHPIFKKQVIATKLQLGYLRSVDITNTNIYGSELYYVGGANSVRGYDDLSPFANGNKQAIGSTEYRFLFTPNFQFILFIDIGYATLDNIYDFNKYKMGKGFGIRLNIPPLGPIRLDLGFNEENQSQFHFSVGHTF